MQKDRYTNFNHEKFWVQVQGVIGEDVIARDALAMYFCMLDNLTDYWIKLIIAKGLENVGQLKNGYAYYDDFMAFCCAYDTLKNAHEQVKPFITDAHYQKADEILNHFQAIRN